MGKIIVMTLSTKVLSLGLALSLVVMAGCAKKIPADQVPEGDTQDSAAAQLDVVGADTDGASANTNLVIEDANTNTAADAALVIEDDADVNPDAPARDPNAGATN